MNDVAAHSLAFELAVTYGGYWMVIPRVALLHSMEAANDDDA